jgi:hypothetical protein
MNRSIVLLGVGILVVGFGLVASPIILYGSEMFTLEQEFGIFLSPVGLLVVLIGAVQANPERTTVRGTFGNPDMESRHSGAPAAPASGRAGLGYNPREPVNCRYCGSVITYDLAFCPRCARPRACRGCGRILGMAGDRTDCGGCHRVEAFCNCSRLARPMTTPSVGSSRRPRV